MRISNLIALSIAVAACSPAPPAVAEGTELVLCAVNGASKFARKCAVERSNRGGQQVLVIRHPDGGFRRFVLSADGRELAAADGADVVSLALVGKQTEVRVDVDAYRFSRPLTGNVARP